MLAEAGAEREQGPRRHEQLAQNVVQLEDPGGSERREELVAAREAPVVALELRKPGGGRVDRGRLRTIDRNQLVLEALAHDARSGACRVARKADRAPPPGSRERRAVPAHHVTAVAADVERPPRSAVRCGPAGHARAECLSSPGGPARRPGAVVHGVSTLVTPRSSLRVPTMSPDEQEGVEVPSGRWGSNPRPSAWATEKHGCIVSPRYEDGSQKIAWLQGLSEQQRPVGFVRNRRDVNRDWSATGPRHRAGSETDGLADEEPNDGAPPWARWARFVARLLLDLDAPSGFCAAVHAHLLRSSKPEDAMDRPKPARHRSRASKAQACHVRVGRPSSVSVQNL